MPLGRLTIPALLLLAACAAPGPTPGFHDLQAEQTAIQTALNDARDGIAHAWQGSGGMTGTATALGPADEPGCRRLRTEGPGGADEDVWCPTPHGFWVHAEERFFRNSTGEEKYGGPPLERRSGSSARRGADAETRPSQADCLDDYRASRRYEREGRDSRARAADRDFHRCMHRSY